MAVLPKAKLITAGCLVVLLYLTKVFFAFIPKEPGQLGASVLCFIGCWILVISGSQPAKQVNVKPPFLHLPAAILQHSICSAVLKPGERETKM